MCIFINDKCEEQYKTCSLYYDNENEIKEDIYKSIVINDATNTYSSDKHICKYNAPSSGGKGSCIAQERSCVEFNPELYRDFCQAITLNDQTKKCVFSISNKSCSPEYKTCLEMSILASATDDKCKNGDTSSNKVCTAKPDRSGCEETDKPPKPNTTASHTPPKESQKDGESNNDDNNDNSAGKQCLSKIIFIAFCLLF